VVDDDGVFGGDCFAADADCSGERSTMSKWNLSDRPAADCGSWAGVWRSGVSDAGDSPARGNCAAERYGVRFRSVCSGSSGHSVRSAAVRWSSLRVLSRAHNAVWRVWHRAECLMEPANVRRVRQPLALTGSQSENTITREGFRQPVKRPGGFERVLRAVCVIRGALNHEVSSTIHQETVLQTLNSATPPNCSPLRWAQSRRFRSRLNSLNRSRSFRPRNLFNVDEWTGILL